jgi:guanylate kinase
MGEIMGKIFYIMGKSASGKDSIFRKLREDNAFSLKEVIPYTTRPIRSGEENGAEYFFTDETHLAQMRREGKVIECRTYDTVHGPWSYFTADDGQIDLARGNYRMIGTLESYEQMQHFFGRKALIPLYIYVEDGERLMRALVREREQATPRYREMCRRFLADEEDFSEENLARCGIDERYENEDFDRCYEDICRKIQAEIAAK